MLNATNIPGLCPSKGAEHRTICRN